MSPLFFPFVFLFPLLFFLLYQGLVVLLELTFRFKASYIIVVRYSSGSISTVKLPLASYCIVVVWLSASV